MKGYLEKVKLNSSFIVVHFKICGLTLDTSEENLALQYLATVQAVVYGTRHIIASLRDYGAPVSCMLLCGGLTKSELFVKTMADAVGMALVIPEEQESVLLGSAILAASASKRFASLGEAMKSMAATGAMVLPDADEHEFHERKYRVFIEMLQDQRKYERIMNSKVNIP